MRDRIPKYPGRVILNPVSGQENTFDLVRADEPLQEGTPLNKETLLTDATAAAIWTGETTRPADPTVNEALAAVANIAAGWKLLATYDTAGAYTFVVPENVVEIGVLMMGGGGSGAACVAEYPLASGGGSGEFKQKVFSVSAGEISPNQEVAVVVGAGGEAVSTTGGVKSGFPGGSTSFNEETATGGGSGKAASTYFENGYIYNFGASPSGGLGQISDYVNYYTLREKAPFGFAKYANTYNSGVSTSDVLYNEYPAKQIPLEQPTNFFDRNDYHVFCGAGGGARLTATYQTTEERRRGHAGAAGKGTGGDATSPGDGGGAATNTSGSTATSGRGADGIVLVYGRVAV